MVGSSRKSTRGRWISDAASSHFIRSPERELAGGLVDHAAQVEQLDQLADAGFELRPRDLVDGPVQGEGLGRRQVPEELLLLPHHQGDGLEEGVLATGRDEAGHPYLAGAGMEEPGEDLQRGGLARPVRAEEPDALPGSHGEGDAVDGLDRLVAAPEERADRCAEPRLAPVDLVLLAQLADLDHGTPR